MPSQPPETPQSKLPKLDPEAVNHIPAIWAAEFNIIPVAGTRERLRVVCATPLTNEQVEKLKWLCPGIEFDFITDPSEYPDVRKNIRQLIEQCYPEEQVMDVLGID